MLGLIVAYAFGRRSRRQNRPRRPRDRVEAYMELAIIIFGLVYVFTHPA